MRRDREPGEGQEEGEDGVRGEDGGEGEGREQCRGEGRDGGEGEETSSSVKKRCVSFRAIVAPAPSFFRIPLSQHIPVRVLICPMSATSNHER